MSGAGQNRIKMRWKGRRRGQESFSQFLQLLFNVKKFPIYEISFVAWSVLPFCYISADASAHTLFIHGRTNRAPPAYSEKFIFNSNFILIHWLSWKCFGFKTSKSTVGVHEAIFVVSYLTLKQKIRLWIFLLNTTPN